LDAAETAFLLIGCTLVVSCFATVQNVAYRAIWFLCALPALTASGRAGRWLAIAIVLLMWNGTLRHAVNAAGGLRLGIWLARELAWWAVVTLLAALLLRLLWEQPAAAMLRRRLM
jgi:hypothetical protein